MRCGYAAWLALILCLAALHALHLSADFPNHSPWFSDWAKYTDEGWFGNGAVRQFVLGSWFLPGDFNPAAPLPVWPFLEWILFHFTGVQIEAARALAVACFFVNLWLSYRLVRAKAPRWAALLAVTLLVASPFLYCFTRLAILEPMLMLLTLTAFNLTVRLPHWKNPILGAALIGLLFTLLMLTKTAALFLLPAITWALLLPLWQRKKPVFRSALAAGATFAILYGSWLAMLAHRGLFPDYRYLYAVNDYAKPKEVYWPIVSFWWSFHGTLWIDLILIPLAGFILFGAFVARRSAWAQRLLWDPIYGACILGTAGYIFFMTMQDHPQPRYFAMVTYFLFILIAKGAASMLAGEGAKDPLDLGRITGRITGRIPGGISGRKLGWVTVAFAFTAVVVDTAWTLNYATHPEYTFVNAARQLTSYIDTHPNGKRLLLSISGDQISLVTQLPALCDDFVTPSAKFPDLPSKIAFYQPGWYAAWNDLDPGTLEDLHTRYSLEQVASYPAFDDPDRNLLVLFKLHPLPGGAIRSESDSAYQTPMPGDKIDIPIE